MSVAVCNGEKGRLILDHDSQHQGHHKPGQRPSWWSLTGEGHSWEMEQGIPS